VRARVAATTRKPVVADAAGEELVSDLRDDGPRRASALRDRGAPSIHRPTARPVTFCCATGCFDATSAWRRP